MIIKKQVNMNFSISKKIEEYFLRKQKLSNKNDLFFERLCFFAAYLEICVRLIGFLVGSKITDCRTFMCDQSRAANRNKC